jgi:hypothetical protein
MGIAGVEPRQWQYDRNAMHAGRANTYSFVHDGKQRTSKPMQDDQIKSDVELVVHKAKLRSAKPKSGLATPQHEEHDANSVSGNIVSAKPVDDKLVVLVSDKPVEVKPYIDEGKDMSACIPCVPLQFVLTWVFRPMTVVLIVFRYIRCHG